MHIELINTGQELLLGRILNTHQQWICRQLADLGYVVNRQICVADEGVSIQAAVRESLERSDLVLTTGGLGPTSDDITRELIARLLGRELALPFRSGGGRSWVVLLPGPPRELRPMFLNAVVPLLLTEFLAAGKFISRTLKTTGLGESLVEERIAGPLQGLVARGLELGYCARVGEVEVRLAARGGQAANIVEEAEAIVRGLLRSLIFAEEDGTLEATVVKMLTDQNKTVALAESCTGGMISHRLTNVPGASAVLKCGLVTYSNEAKRDLLGVGESAIAEEGAVSETVARQMAEGARNRCRTDYAIAVTGIAGPGGGSEAKPVGTVFIALADAQGTIVKRKLNQLDRETFKFVTSQQALDLLRWRMISED
jgi:nicotinamide-nucleotide amidase